MRGAAQVSRRSELRAARKRAHSARRVIATRGTGTRTRLADRRRTCGDALRRARRLAGRGPVVTRDPGRGADRLRDCARIDRNRKALKVNALSEHLCELFPRVALLARDEVSPARVCVLDALERDERDVADIRDADALVELVLSSADLQPPLHERAIDAAAGKVTARAAGAVAVDWRPDGEGRVDRDELRCNDGLLLRLVLQVEAPRLSLRHRARVLGPPGRLQRLRA